MNVIVSVFSFGQCRRFGIGMVLQEAVSGPQAWQTQLQCLLAAASIQLPACPPALNSHPAQAPGLVLSTAMLSAITTLADDLHQQLPGLQTRMQGAGYSQADGLGELLAKVQWQVVGLVQGLYACLAATAFKSNSPPRRSLDVKVPHIP